MEGNIRKTPQEYVMKKYPMKNRTLPSRKLTSRILVVLALLLAGPLAAAVGSAMGGAVNLDADWRTASRESAGLAPDPATTPEAVVQVYAARAFGWRGLFGVHSWIAAKRENAPAYTVYQVIGWRALHSGSALAVGTGVPDREWFGNAPEILADFRGGRDGVDVETMIDAMDAAVAAYPYAGEYRLWPGPNSNTFTAFVGRRVPAMNLHLPVTAIGKDYLANGSLLASAPSGSGVQLSLLGIVGITLAQREGVEINLLGLGFGVDFLRPALKLPGIGRIGMDRE